MTLDVKLTLVVKMHHTISGQVTLKAAAREGHQSEQEKKKTDFHRRNWPLNIRASMDSSPFHLFFRGFFYRCENAANCTTLLSVLFLVAAFFCFSWWSLSSVSWWPLSSVSWWSLSSVSWWCPLCRVPSGSGAFPAA